MPGLLQSRDYYKPFDYPWAFDYYRKQTIEMHWSPEEIPLHEDIRDWNFRLNNTEREVITQILNLFTQSDVDVAKGYFDHYIPMFKPPEVRMMLGAFANMESIHQHAYSHFTDTIGMPVEIYKVFRDYAAMVEKHEYLETIKSSEDPVDILTNVAVYSAFTEGLQLFSSFAILLKFPHMGKMKGLGQIVSYSIKDESLHVEAMIKLFKSLMSESALSNDDKDRLKGNIYKACEEMTNLETMFIHNVFKLGSLTGLDSEDMVKYNRYIADRRLLQLELNPLFKQKENPLPWLDEVLGVEFADFFSTKDTSYQKGGLKGNKSLVVF